MGIWYTDETWGTSGARHAGNKAREDVSSILSDMGAMPVRVDFIEDKTTLSDKLSVHFNRLRLWKKAIAPVQCGDLLVFQLPLISHTVLATQLIKYCKKRSIKVVALIHDVECLRSYSRRERVPFKIQREEIDFLRNCDAVICHNLSMIDALSNKFRFDPSRCVSLDLFDYLLPDNCIPNTAQFSTTEPIIVAGNLSALKAGYLYSNELPFDVNLYGVNFDSSCATPKLNYFGSFLPDELPFVMRGSFGLVWDGDSCSTCSGNNGMYLRVNNSHKASLYLACGIPVIVWSKSALAPLVEKSGVGFTVNSLSEVPSVISALDEPTIQHMYLETLKMSKKLRSGFYLKSALNRVKSNLVKRAYSNG